MLYYVHTGLSSFVEKDIEILKKNFNLKIIHLNFSKKILIPFYLISTFFKLLNANRNSVIVSQFAGYHTLPQAVLTKWFKKKSIIILGGTDCVNFPLIKYGNYNKSLLSFSTKFSITNSSLLLPVHQSLIYREEKYDLKNPNHQGYLAYCNAKNIPVNTIHNGYESSLWKLNTTKRRSNSFITIGSNLGSRFGFKLKGIDLFIEMAEKNPDAYFCIIGGDRIQNKKNLNNLIYHSIVPNNLLNNLLNEYEFYVQLSLSEGFPNALCESMLSGCIPIVSNVASMPEIVGNNGFVLDKKDSNLCDEIFKKLIKLDSLKKEELSIFARNHIVDNFSLKKRELKLVNVINSLIQM